MEVQKSDTGNATEVVSPRSFTLKELAENYIDIKKRMDASGQEASDELEQAHEIAKYLLANKLDNVWALKKQVEAHNEALQSQLAYNNKLIEDVDYFTTLIAESVPDRKIQGNSVSFTLQKNSRGSVVITDESLIPNDFRKVKIEISDSFDATDSVKLRHYYSFILGRDVADESSMTDADLEKISESVSVVVSKTLIEQDLKAGKSVAGAEYEVGFHPRWRVGKVKVKQIEG